MHTELSTRSWSQPERLMRWAEAITDTYFPLSLDFAREQKFDGNLQRWGTTSTALSLSRLRSSKLLYSRDREQIKSDDDAFYLITVACRADIQFEQAGHSVRCPPGGFIVERGSVPYSFYYGSENDLWVLKLPESAFAGHIRCPERYSKYNFDGTKGLGKVFVEQLSLCAKYFDECPGSGKHLLLEQALSTLFLALQQDDRVLGSECSNLASMHLTRVESFVRKNLHDPELSAQVIAGACGLSLRYLYKLFADAPHSLSEWIRMQRLEGIHRQLRDPSIHLPIGELAFRWGFSDQAQFARAFRQQFGCTAREVKSTRPH